MTKILNTHKQYDSVVGLVRSGCLRRLDGFSRASLTDLSCESLCHISSTCAALQTHGCARDASRSSEWYTTWSRRCIQTWQKWQVVSDNSIEKSRTEKGLRSSRSSWWPQLPLPSFPGSLGTPHVPPPMPYATLPRRCCHFAFDSLSV